jgi:hypothetical protein
MLTILRGVRIFPNDNVTCTSTRKPEMDSQPAIWERSEGGAGRAGGRLTPSPRLCFNPETHRVASHDGQQVRHDTGAMDQPTNQPLLLVGPCFPHTLLRHVVMTGDWSRFQGHSAGTQAKQMHIVPVPPPLLHSVVVMPLHFLHIRPSWPLSVSPSLFFFAVIFLSILLVSGTIPPFDWQR